MNIFDSKFSPKEAVLKYMDHDFVVLQPGSYVKCAITGNAIPIDDLLYWSVERQEPYADVEAANEAYRRYGA